MIKNRNYMFGGDIMANIFDKFLDSMKLYDDDEAEEEELSEEFVPEEFEEPEEEPQPEPAKPKKGLFARRQPREEVEEEEEEVVEERPRPSARYGRSNVTPMRPSASRADMEVNMIKPTSMEDARDICDMLLSGRAVVINLEGVQVDLAQRIIDFSSGACYSIDGNLQKISSYIFIITPSNIELTGEFQNMNSNTSVAAR